MADRSDRLPHAIGPYRILRILGQGGMGRVYSAKHAKTGEHVALKTISVADGTRLASIRREIYTLSRIEHPGIVRIVDQGVSDGHPWYAMELIRGCTLADILAECRHLHHTSRATEPAANNAQHGASPTMPQHRPGSPPPERPVVIPALDRYSLAWRLLLIRRLCAPLSYLHCRGIVHRDLKPDNVLIRENDDMPVIVDLGIATQFAGIHSREVVIPASDPLGAYAYMAPEQIRAEYVDARADLYSLGCVLYECVTLQPPVPGADGSSSGRCGWDEPGATSPKTTSWPPQLHDLVLRLLQKNPRDRLGYAKDVDAALAALGVEGTTWPHDSDSRPYLYRPELAGRNDALKALDDLLASATSDCTGKCVFVGGESGVGKTRLAMELTHRAHRRSLAVVTGQCLALSPVPHNKGEQIRAAPLHPLRPLLLAVADLCRERGADTMAALLGERIKVLAAYEPSLVQFPGAAQYPDPVPLPADQARARLFRCLRDTLFALASDQPLLLVIDDLQWADELSLGFLNSLDAGELAQHRAIIVGTYRVEEMNRDLEALVRAAGAHNLQLKGLDAECVQAVVSDMVALSEPPPQQFVAYLTEISAGNPFFIAEYMQSAISVGHIYRDDDGRWCFHSPPSALPEVVPLPQTLDALIESHLAGLDGDCVLMLQSAAVLGRTFSGELLTKAARMNAAAAMAALETLRRQPILSEGDAGELCFIHDKIREIAYAGIAELQAPQLHHQAAVAIEESHGDDPAWYQALAHQWSLAAVPDKAARYFIRAGNHARDRFANREAIGYYRAAIREIGQLISAVASSHTQARVPAQCVEVAVWEQKLDKLHEHLGDLLALTGERSNARTAYSGALAWGVARSRVLYARLYRKIGRTWATHHRYDNALISYDTAALVLGPPPGGKYSDWWSEWCQLQLDRIHVYYWRAQVEQMKTYVEQVQPLVEARGPALQRAVFFNGLLHLLTLQQRYYLSEDDALIARKALDAARESGQVKDIAYAHFVFAMSFLFQRNKLERAEQEMKQALEESERIGDVTLQSRCLTYLTTIYRRLGRGSQTETQAERSLHIAEQAKLPAYVGVAQGHLGWVAWRRGHDAAAREYCQEAVARWEQLAADYRYSMQWASRLLLLFFALQADDLDQAAEHARILIDKGQEALPDSVEESLYKGLNAYDAGATNRARDSFNQAIQKATEYGYL